MSIANYILVILLSLITTIIFAALIIYSDRKSREPVYMIIISLCTCLFTISLSLLLGQIILPKLDVISEGLFDLNTHNIIKIAILAMVEEYSKLLVLYLFISRNKHFDDIYDGFVYSTLIALSFAALESLIYVFNESNIDAMKSLALIRGVTTVPLHLICGIVMGYYMGVEKFSWGTKRRLLNLILCLIVPTFLHFLYNYFMSVIVVRYSTTSYLILIMMLFFIPFYLVAILYIRRTKLLNDKFINNERYKYLMTKDEYIEIINKQY